MKMKNVNEKSNLKLNRVNNFDHRVEQPYDFDTYNLFLQQFFYFFIE